MPDLSLLVPLQDEPGNHEPPQVLAGGLECSRQVAADHGAVAPKYSLASSSVRSCSVTPPFSHQRRRTSPLVVQTSRKYQGAMPDFHPRKNSGILERRYEGPPIFSRSGARSRSKNIQGHSSVPPSASSSRLRYSPLLIRHWPKAPRHWRHAHFLSRGARGEL